MKKALLAILLTAATAMLVVTAMWGRDYYEHRYVGSDYYAMVPEDFDTTPETLYDNQGTAQEMGRNYMLTAYNEDGDHRVLELVCVGTIVSPTHSRATICCFAQANNWC